MRYEFYFGVEQSSFVFILTAALSLSLGGADPGLPGLSTSAFYSGSILRLNLSRLSSDGFPAVDVKKRKRSPLCRLSVASL